MDGGGGEGGEEETSPLTPLLEGEGNAGDEIDLDLSQS